MTLFGEPLGTFVPGLVFVLAMLLLGWLIHRRRQASPAARKVRARGWAFNDATDFEGPLLPGLPHQTQAGPAHGLPRPPAGGAFRFSTCGGWPWAQRHRATDEDGVCWWQFRAMHVQGQYPASDARLHWPGADELPAWRARLAALADPPLQAAQLVLRVEPHVLEIRAEGVEVKDTDAAIAWADACLALLVRPHVAD